MENNELTYTVGDKIKFKSERQRYTITACNDRFIVATKPFNPMNTFLYTIIDLETNQRGPDNCYCYADYDKSEEAQKVLELLHKGEVQLSGRRSMDLDLERIDNVKS